MQIPHLGILDGKKASNMLKKIDIWQFAIDIKQNLVQSIKLRD